MTSLFSFTRQERSSPSAAVLPTYCPSGPTAVPPTKNTPISTQKEIGGNDYFLSTLSSLLFAFARAYPTRPHSAETECMVLYGRKSSRNSCSMAFACRLWIPQLDNFWADCFGISSLASVNISVFFMKAYKSC